ncbi:polysaccharide biosynthesis tyrosine autokinase [Curtobacterium flaccumfaciens]|uniref:polysaccharide biosynthesis tyrosine autokinase n=1 Tax=Curtobacterium flaccumfaciens TaxID=2035 RepID=UPI002175D3E4|nr:polysaccharide biosynthesis tyrosine autokinase [Curtobacterium flaccumfaciens]MCS5494408.1 polysaccharide biosynthesis tyrosine autokinase [Curtobacterium flaccumfaciens pv. flaccumfaciens]
MTLSDFLRIIRRSLVVLLVATVAGGGVGALIAVASTPQYRSTGQVFVSVQPGAPDVNDLAQGNNAAQQKVNSYVQVVRSASVLQPVIDELRLDTTVTELAQHVASTATVDSVLLDISVTEDDPKEAARVAAAVIASFAQVVTENLEKPTDGGASLVRIETVQPPLVPGAPSSPDLVKYVALGLAFGLALGVGGALVRQTLDSKVRTQEDVVRVTSVPVLGAIGFDAAATTNPLVVHSDPRNPRAESFRSLRTNIQFVETDAQRRSFTITSAIPSEGKSTTAANLAITMAESGSRVVLVDADLRRPRIAELMGIEGAVGLSDLLIGRTELEDVTIPWGRGSLSVLPAGQIPPNPSELLGSNAMLALIDQLTTEFDFVIFDAPPLLPVTDAAVLSRLTGGAVVISSVRRVTQKQLASALDALRSIGSKTLGVVMTMVPTKDRGAYDTYYAAENAALSAPSTPKQGRRTRELPTDRPTSDRKRTP